MSKPRSSSQSHASSLVCGVRASVRQLTAQTREADLQKVEFSHGSYPPSGQVPPPRRVTAGRYRDGNLPSSPSIAPLRVFLIGAILFTRSHPTYHEHVDAEPLGRKGGRRAGSSVNTDQ